MKTRTRTIKFTESDKLSILREYYSSGASKSEISKKYELSRNQIDYWIKIYSIESEALSLPAEIIEDVMARKKLNEPDEIARLQARIKDLEKALAFSQLGIKARDIMIDLAEKQENIQIRKKAGAR